MTTSFTSSDNKSLTQAGYGNSLGIFVVRAMRASTSQLVGMLAILVGLLGLPESLWAQSRTDDVPVTAGFLHGGLASAYGNTGLVLGGGVSSFPFGNDHAELEVDGNYVRASGTSGFYGSGNVLYHFRAPDRKLTPSAGGGLGYVDVRRASDVAVQLVGGVTVPLENERTFSGRLRLVFTPGDTTIVVLGGITFR